MNSKRVTALLLLLTCVLVGLASAQQKSHVYLLGPGDVVEVRVFGQPDLSVTAQVDSDGNLSALPFLDPIKAKCRTESQVQRDVTAAYRKLVNSPQVAVRIVERNSRQPATVSGAVKQSAKVPVERKVRLNEVIAASGGFAENAAGTIQIVHTEPVMCPVAGEDVALPVEGDLPMQVVKISDLKKGVAWANPVIRPGDLVLVTESEPVYIIGSVVRPSSILLRDQLTLTHALAMVGGTRQQANLSEIRILRQIPGSREQELIKVDFAAIKRNEEPDVVLKPYDVVDVSEHGLISFVGLKEVFLGILTGRLRNLVPVIP